MKGIEIRKKIDENNEMMVKYLNPNVYVLNNVVRDLLVENAELQKICEHKFDEDGFCIYCDYLRSEE